MWLAMACGALAAGCGNHHDGKGGSGDGDQAADPSALSQGDDQDQGDDRLGALAGNDGVGQPPAGDGAVEPLVLDPEQRSRDLAADYRGFYAVNDILEQRLMVENGGFFLGNYLDAPSRDYVFGLPELLGYDAGSGLHAEFRNGKGNAVNIVLWHLTTSSVARDVARQCGEQPVQSSYSLKPEFIEVLRPLCAWPAAEARKTAPLVLLWQTVMSYDAPRTEFEAFKEFFQGPDWDGADGEQAVAAMMTAMLMNPHFLVRQ
jgi:hypothetical protein